ncbi:MAG: sugar nucleotide-binding protein [Myxococcales bacterium]|nr:sugar nucleotide-binding protein [Myxococcales bacterium]
MLQPFQPPAAPIGRVVVTGARGFVGSEVIRQLAGAGRQAIPFDLRDGLDICSEADLLEVIREGDDVVHLAAYADLYRARERPVEATRVNVVGTSCVAEVTRRRGGRLILGSTLCVYGNQPTYPTREDAAPNPSEIYAQTKLAAEQVVRGMVDSLGLRAVIVRFPGVYGPGMRGALAVACFMRAAREGGVLEIHGDGLQTRTPMHVSDVARGLLALLQRPEIDGVINLAAPEEISALELARRIISLAGAGTIRHGPQRTPQTLRELADGSRAAAVGWTPSIGLSEGLASTWKWFLEHSA